MRDAWLFAALTASLACGQPLQEAAGVPYEVRHVQGNVYMFASTLGNIAIQVGKDPGHDGVLLVDTGPARLRDTILAEIRKLSDEPVRFMITTSPDADHNGSNEILLKRRPRREVFRPSPKWHYSRRTTSCNASPAMDRAFPRALGRPSHFWMRRASHSMERSDSDYRRKQCAHRWR